MSGLSLVYVWIKSIKWYNKESGQFSYHRLARDLKVLALLKTDLESAMLNLQGIWANMTTQFSDFGQNEVLQVSFYFLLIITIFIAKKKYCGLTLW